MGYLGGGGGVFGVDYGAFSNQLMCFSIDKGKVF